jgi:hypothetical protein
MCVSPGRVNKERRKIGIKTAVYTIIARGPVSRAVQVRIWIKFLLPYFVRVFRVVRG